MAPCDGKTSPILHHMHCGRAPGEVCDESQETWQDVTQDQVGSSREHLSISSIGVLAVANHVLQLEEPTEEVLTTQPDIDIEESDADSSVVESLRAATSALERRCGVLERIIAALVGHHRKTYSSIVYLGCSVFVLLIGELIRQSVKMERRLVAW